MGTLPLEGIRVVDFTHDWVGPFSTRVLGDFGAQVIKVEYAKRMCPFRGGYLENRKYNRHPRWHQVNRNKFSVTLNLELEIDRQAFKDLVKISDVLVKNCRPGVMEKFGLSYQDLKKLKPDIVFVSLTAFGATGPYASYAGYGATIEPLSGVNQLTAHERNGQRYRVKEMDVSNGLMAACAIMTALLHRQRTGEGQFVDLSQMETAIHMLAGEHLLEYSMNGTQTLPLGNRHRWYAPQGCYRCMGDDKWVTITIRTNRQWRRLCEVLGHPEWISDPRFSKRQNRSKNLDELDRAIEDWTNRHSHLEVMQILQEKSIPAGAVLNVSELCQDPHLEKRHYFMKASDGSKDLFPGMIARIPDAPGQIFRRGPNLGQHNEYVLCTLLGRARDDVRPLEENDIGTSYDPE